MDNPTPPNDSLVLSYLGLRKAIGIIGIALPFVLVIGKFLLQGPGIEVSISDYYYTDMRNVFVGSLCAIAIFLMSYRGYDQSDRIAGALACGFAIGVALFPTTPGGEPTSEDQFVGHLHIVFACCFFLTLAFFSLVLFRKTDQVYPTRKKLQRNIVYTACGYIILGCIILIGIVNLPAIKPLIGSLDPVFWFESIAVVAFGVSWLTKGEAILKDDAT